MVQYSGTPQVVQYNQRGGIISQPIIQAPFYQPFNPADMPKLQNIVSTANLNCKNLDLRDIARRCKNVEYKPKRFAAAIMRIREPRTTALIFASGRMVCTGAKSEEDSYKAAKRYAKHIKQVGYP